MKRSYRIQDGKILIYQEIELTDHAQYLKFDWHLYNLSKDIDEENDKTKKKYLQIAEEQFANEIAKSKPNKRVDLFGNHSAFYYLYGHTADWINVTKQEILFMKALLVCITEEGLNTIQRIRNSSYRRSEELEDNLSKALGIEASSAKRILSMKLNQLYGIESKVLEIQLAEEEAFLQKLIKLQKAENNNG